MPRSNIRTFPQITRRFFRQLQAIDRKLVRLSAALALPKTPAAPLVPPPAVPQREYGDLTGAVMVALLPGPKTKRELRAELHAQGFAFGGPPLAVLDSVLYTKRFRRAGKLFWLA